MLFEECVGKNMMDLIYLFNHFHSLFSFTIDTFESLSLFPYLSHHPFIIIDVISKL